MGLQQFADFQSIGVTYVALCPDADRSPCRIAASLHQSAGHKIDLVGVRKHHEFDNFQPKIIEIFIVELFQLGEDETAATFVARVVPVGPVY
jgi:hypothetical protein